MLMIRQVEFAKCETWLPSSADASTTASQSRVSSSASSPYCLHDAVGASCSLTSRKSSRDFHLSWTSARLPSSLCFAEVPSSSSSSSSDDAEQDALQALAMVLSENGLSGEDASLVSSQAPITVRSLVQAAQELDELAGWSSDLKLVEKERDCLQRAYEVAKASRGQQIAAIVESIGVEQRHLSRVSLVVASQNLPELLEKINFLKYHFPHEKDEATTIRSRRMMKQLSISADEGLQKTLSFFEKMEARQGGLSLLSSPGGALPLLIEEFPQILVRSLESEIKPIFGYLENLGVPKQQVASVIMCYPSTLLSGSIENLQRRFRSLKKVGIKSKDFGKMLIRYPWILSSSIEHNVENVASFLETLMAHKGNSGPLITKCPNLLGCSPITLEKVISHIDSLGVPRKRLAQAISQSPQLLLKTPQAFNEVYECFQAVGVAEKDMGKILLRSPEVFASTTSFLKGKIAFLQEMGIPKSRLKVVVVKYPSVLMMSIEDGLKPRVNFFQSMGLSKQDVSFMVCGFPPLLGYSVEGVLKPKFEFLENVICHPVKEVVTYPRYFSFCLQKKIKPRVRVLSRLGLEWDLKSILSKSDDEFAADYLGVGRMLVPPP